MTSAGQPAESRKSSELVRPARQARPELRTALLGAQERVEYRTQHGYLHTGQDAIDSRHGAMGEIGRSGDAASRDPAGASVARVAASLVIGEPYLLAAARSVELNPGRATLVVAPSEYRFVGAVSGRT